MPRERGRILLSMIDRRIRYREGQEQDVLALLVSRIRERGYPLLESFLSRSPKIESLATNPDGRAHSILAAAPGSIVTNQMRHVTDELLKCLDRLPLNRPGLSPRRELDTRQLEVLGEKKSVTKAPERNASQPESLSADSRPTASSGTQRELPPPRASVPDPRARPY
jgi:hypothetical protein